MEKLYNLYLSNKRFSVDTNSSGDTKIEVDLNNDEVKVLLYSIYSDISIEVLIDSLDLDLLRHIATFYNNNKSDLERGNYNG